MSTRQLTRDGAAPAEPGGETGGLFVACRLYIVYRQSPLGPVDPSFRALSGRLKFTVRHHKFNNDSLSVQELRRLEKDDPDFHKFLKSGDEGQVSSSSLLLSSLELSDTEVYAT